MAHSDAVLNRRGVAVVLAALLVALGAVRVWRGAQRVPGIDFYQFWVVGHVVGRGDVTSVYADDTRAAAGQEFSRRASGPEGSDRQRAAARMRQVLEPMATPFLYAALRPFGGARYDPSFDAFTAFGLASLLAGAWVLCGLVGLAVLERLLLLALVVHSFQPLQADVRVGNVNQIQLGLLALYAWLGAGSRPWRQASAGAVLGAAVAFKPTLALVAPVLFAGWMAARQWRRLAAQAAGMAAGVLGAVSAGAAFFGSFGAWGDWLAAVRAAPLAAMPVDVGNVSPLAVAEKWTGLSPGIVPAAVAAVVLALALWRGRARPATAAAEPDPARDVLRVSAGCLWVLLAAPLVWQHYLILALPAVIVLLRSAAAARRWLAIVGYAAIAIDPYADLFGLTDPARQAPIVVAGVALLFVLVAWEVARVRPPPAAEPADPSP
jgi:hypothetical protein